MYAVRFNRTGALGALSRTANLPPIASFTMMGWVLVLAGNTITNTVFALGGSTSASAFYGLQFNVGPLSLWNGSTNVDSVSTLPGGWVHLAMVVLGTGAGQFLAYVNGVLTITHAGNAAVTSAKMFVGNDNASAGEPFLGHVAAIKVYDRALTVGEIVTEMQYAVPVSQAGLNAAYPIPSEWDLAASRLWLPRGVTTRWADISGFNREWAETATIDLEAGPAIPFAPAPQVRRSRLQTIVAATKALPPFTSRPRFTTPRRRYV